MARPVITSVVIDATPAEVWADVADISSHVHWMLDAEAIEFTTEQRHGVGTAFDCLTKVGPIKLNDHMEIVSWEDEKLMGVRHDGLVTGTGAFTLTPVGDTRTEFRWEETLTFPIWLGGPIGAAVSRPILAAIWRGNLRRLKERIESA